MSENRKYRIYQFFSFYSATARNWRNNAGVAGHDAIEVQLRKLIGTVFLVAASTLSVHAESVAPAAVPVGTVKAERKAISKSLEFVGRVEAVNRVEIKARVKGFLEEVLFKEGDLIREGAPLYRIEKALFEADVQKAEGDLARSKAANALAQLDLNRAEELLKRDTGTVVTRDKALTQVQTTQGQILADESNLNTAKINLGYTAINAPISGKIGRTRITRGNVVGPDSGLLTTIVSQDPMYVTFPVSQREFLRVRQSEIAQVDPRKIEVQLRFSDGSTFDQTGQVDFIDVSVDGATDTITARAVVPNPKGRLIDNQLVRVVLDVGNPKEKVVVSQSALIADQEGVYVFAVEDGKAVTKRLKVSSENGADIVVEDGLAGGEQIIVQGLQGVRAGAAVRATPMMRSVSEK
ncbi:MAG TPA: efflux RND transporter periplasmic adaptor subunit [Hyphomicrobiales bacterium]|jgi:membrane fusion protein (multidrug efflux system)